MCAVYILYAISVGFTEFLILQGHQQLMQELTNWLLKCTCAVYDISAMACKAYSEAWYYYYIYFLLYSTSAQHKVHYDYLN